MYEMYVHVEQCVWVRVKCSLVYLNNCHFSGIFILQLNTSERQGSFEWRSVCLHCYQVLPERLSVWYRFDSFVMQTSGFFCFSFNPLERASAYSSLNRVSSVARDILVLVHIITNIFLALELGLRMLLHLCVMFGRRQTHVMKVFCPQIYFTWIRLIKYLYGHI